MILILTSVLSLFISDVISYETNTSPTRSCIAFTYTDFEVDEAFSRAVATSTTPNRNYDYLLRYQICECALRNIDNKLSFKTKILNCLRRRLTRYPNKIPNRRNLPVS